MWRDQEKFEVIRTPRYLYDDTSSSGVLLRTRVGREEMKEEDLQVIIILILLLLELIVRSREESQDDILC